MSHSPPSKSYPVVAPGKSAWFVFVLIALAPPIALTGFLLARPQPWQDVLWIGIPIALLIPGFLWAAMRRRV